MEFRKTYDAAEINTARQILIDLHGAPMCAPEIDLEDGLTKTLNKFEDYAVWIVAEENGQIVGTTVAAVNAIDGIGILSMGTTLLPQHRTTEGLIELVKSLSLIECGNRTAVAWMRNQEAAIDIIRKAYPDSCAVTPATAPYLVKVEVLVP